MPAKFSLKPLARHLLVQRWVNPPALALARALPGREWQKRLPVARPFSALDLGAQGKVVLARPDRCHVAQELHWGKGALDTPQDRNALAAALAFAREARCFLDIGSYTGLFALAAARINPGLTAYAYEIVGENYLLLWENVLRNDLGGRVVPQLVAVGGEEGVIRIPFDQSGGQLASSVALDWDGPEGVAVPVKRLDDLFPDCAGPVALKIDVEGFEMEVFDGARAFLARHRPDMVCEVLRRAKRVPEMMALLAGLGYRWFHIRENGFARRDTIIADKHRRDWLLTCKSDAELAALGLALVD